eukprot:s893_g12.t1
MQQSQASTNAVEVVWSRFQKAVALLLCFLRAAMAAIWAFLRERYIQHKRHVVMLDWTELEFCPPEIQRDREAVLCAVKQNWQALEFTCEDLRGDREIVQEAVEQDWRALRYASRALRADRELMVMAVEKSNGWALEFAAEELYRDDQLLRDATSRLSGRLGLPLSPITTLVPIDSGSSPGDVDPLSLFETSLPLAVLRARRLEDDAEPLNAEGAQQEHSAENRPEQRSDETNQILSSNSPDPASFIHPDLVPHANGSETGDMAGHGTVMELDSVPQENGGSETGDMAGHATVMESDSVPQENGGSETGDMAGHAAVMEPDSVPQANGSETADINGLAAVMEPDSVPQANGSETADIAGRNQTQCRKPMVLKQETWLAMLQSWNQVECCKQETWMAMFPPSSEI